MKYQLDQAIKRTKELTLDEHRRGILIRCTGFGPLELPKVPPLESCVFPRDTSSYMDAVIASHVKWFEAHQVLDDDYIPALKPFLGIAEHSCFLGGEVRYGGNTSYQEPALDDITDFRRLRFDENRPHYKLLMDCMAYLKKKSSEYGYYVSLRGFDGPMDIANAIRGNDILYDLYDEPEETKAFIDFCADGCLWTSQNQRRYADVVEGGYISGQGLWMPGNAIGHISEDLSSMCSPQMYEEFGLPYTARVLEHFDYAALHVHSLGRSCIPLFKKLQKIKMYQLTDDPNQPTGMEVFREYAPYFEDCLVNVDLDAQGVRDNLDFLLAHRAIVNLNASSVYEAQQIIDLVRERQ